MRKAVNCLLVVDGWVRSASINGVCIVTTRRCVVFVVYVVYIVCDLWVVFGLCVLCV